MHHQGIGHDDQHPADPAGGGQAVNDQAGFDGLAQTGLIGQQHPGSPSAADLGGNGELVGNQIHPPTHESIYR